MVRVCADAPTVEDEGERLVIVGWGLFTANELLVAPVSEPSEANKVKLLSTVGTRFENVATPLDAATVVVEPPLNAPPELIVMLTLEVFEVTTLPLASSTCTVTAGEIAAPAIVVD